METGLKSRFRRKTDLLQSIATILWPQLASMSEHPRIVGAGDVLAFLYTLPLAIAGLIWLAMVTDLQLAAQNWPVFLVIFALIALFNQVSYFIIIEIPPNRFGNADGSLAGMILWSAVFIFGPTALWLFVIWTLAKSVLSIRQAYSIADRWNLYRSLVFDLATNTLALLLALALYRSWGGEFPIAGLDVKTISRALYAIILHLFFSGIIWSGIILYLIKALRRLTDASSAGSLLKFFLLSFGLAHLSLPFGILAAGLFVEQGLVVYLFFVAGLLIVAYLARRLSWMAESNRQQSRQLERLEQLGRALIDAPPDASTLSDLLEEHVPSMFHSGRIAIWLSPGQVIFKHPADWPPVPEEAWLWILTQNRPIAFQQKEKLAWETGPRAHEALLTAPILESESTRPIGAIYMELRSLVRPWDSKSMRNLFPAVQTLAAQIASALHQAEVYAQSLNFQIMTQELELAGRIQASFLPNRFPTIPGWQLAVTLRPARETSGDFFDVIELPGGKLGVLIADVADKGLGPALYMALSRTLIRTYALDYEAEPEVVFYAVNNRLLNDARANLFVTGFYGVLDPESGLLSYCNAGHNPPFLFVQSTNGEVRALGRTGMALGIEEEATWDQASIQIQPGEVLLLYTDGIPDAQSEAGLFFDEERLIETARAHLGKPAHEIQSAILDEVQQFSGNVPQSDDITIMVLVRDQ